ncbi:hypothetical protein BDY19DRAFT_886920 [Irpex rosettiformis]|uniref:Uncharacterized protein n=1 Tax=Irpex rosettiformis TaxID=378272 RepID=A0ACB8U8K6_9APHY|nr:hypothetical protein BDY19DRAFT_886920 [Irpex rosettiformis]
MAFGLTIGTERATALQNAVQDELTKRGYSVDADPVMAEYITIMIINNKTAAQISSELEDLIGSDFDPSFVDWLFAEVAKGAPEAVEQVPVVPEPAPAAQPKPRENPPHLSNELPSKPSNGPGPLYRQALAQAIPSTSPPGQKRTRSARSPSPSGHVNKSRRMDLPTGPRAMQQRDGGGPSGSKSLLERMGPSRNGRAHDEIQARIDSITGPANQELMMMQQGGFPMNGMPPIDMGAMGGMSNPIMLQEMMMSQMAMMAQMAGAMGLLNPGAMGMNGQFQGQPGMPGDMGALNNGPGGPQHHGQDGRGRGRGRGGLRGTGGRGRGGHISGSGNVPSELPSGPIQSSTSAPQEPAPTIVAPTPTPPSTVVAPPLQISPSQSRTAISLPERPQSPTLCKFGLKCTNPLCRYSHPSPVATPESGVVLSNDPCEAGKDCKNKDCVKAHVSPAVLKPHADQLNPKAAVFTPSPYHHPSLQTQVPCRFGAACTRPGCSFMHPPRPSSTPCRFGASCTKATCQFQHPEGRGVLPSTFHRGLGIGPETTSHNKSVTFNTSKTSAQTAAEIEKKVKEVEERKSQAKAAVAQAQAAAAAASSKDSSTKSVSAAA